MAVAFEGTPKAGTRHAHALAYVPQPRKRISSRSKLSSLFPSEFKSLWSQLDDGYDADGLLEDLHITPANEARIVYTAKDVRQNYVPWSRIEFVTPPKFKKLDNKNRQELRKADRQKRRSLGIA